MNKTINVTDVEEKQVQIIKRRTFEIPYMNAVTSQDIVLDLAGADRKELMDIIALNIYNSSNNHNEGMKALDTFKEEMIQVINDIKQETSNKVSYNPNDDPLSGKNLKKQFDEINKKDSTDSMRLGNRTGNYDYYPAFYE